jgi:tape measure domain-containing protein
MSNTGVQYQLSLRDQLTRSLNPAINATEKLNSEMGLAQKSALGLGSAIASIGAGLIAREIVNVTAAMEGLKNQLNFASGSAMQGGRDFEYLRETSEKMGLDFNTAATAFAKFSGAARGTALEGQKVKDIFESVGMASTVMHLSAEQSEGAFRALEQMLSKGKVQAEELRGQLGERIPGAFQIAARSMNMTTAELDKFMSDGKLMSEEFLPKFAAQLKTEFAGGMDAAGQSLQANLNRMNNSFLELKYTVGELFMPVIQGTINLLTEVTKWVKENSPLILGLAAAFTTLAGSVFLYNTYMKVASIYSGAKFIWGLWSLAAALEGVTVAQWLLNTASAFFAGLSGVGLFAVAAAGAAALAVGIYAAKSAQDSLNNSMSKQMGAAAKAVNPMAPTKTQTQTASKTTTAKGGTSTNVVESRGVQNFNIDINKLVENINIQAASVKEGASQIKEQVAQALIEAVNDFQLMATK